MKNDINHFAKVLDTVTRGYIQALYFTDTGGDSDIPNGAELADQTVISCLADCAAFLSYCEKCNLISEYKKLPGVSWDSFGIDFWFTRNGHGVGFWDRGYGEIGDKLSTACEEFKSVDAYLGDDSLIYFA